MTIRVATWNLERCSSRAWCKAPAQQRRLEAVDADIWVLTETFTSRSPGPGFTGVFSPPHAERRPNLDERWTAVWSRWPIEQLDTPAPHRRGTIAARIATPAGPVIVYGTVIAYQHEPMHDDGRPARGWEVHMAEVTRQSAEWQLLRQQHPETPLVVAGDFNQARSGRPRSYGTTATRAAMTDALSRTGLRCLTEVDLVESGAITHRSHVEHICVSDELTASPVLAWDRFDADGVSVSDHPTLAVDLTVN